MKLQMEISREIERFFFSVKAQNLTSDFFLSSLSDLGDL